MLWHLLIRIPKHHVQNTALGSDTEKTLIQNWSSGPFMFTKSNI